MKVIKIFAIGSVFLFSGLSFTNKFPNEFPNEFPKDTKQTLKHPITNQVMKAIFEKIINYWNRNNCENG